MKFKQSKFTNQPLYGSLVVSAVRVSVKHILHLIKIIIKKKNVFPLDGRRARLERRLKLKCFIFPILKYPVMNCIKL